MPLKAREFILQVQDSASPSQYVTIGALIDCTLTISDPPDDITSKGSNGARTLFSDGAVKSYDFSGNLVLTTEEGLSDLRTAKESVTPRIPCKIDDGVSIYTGVFHIETLTLSGGNSGAVRAAIELKSAGAVNVASS